jgi:hypothetical protein
MPETAAGRARGGCIVALWPQFTRAAPTKALIRLRLSLPHSGSGGQLAELVKVLLTLVYWMVRDEGAGRLLGVHVLPVSHDQQFAVHHLG